MKKKGKKILSFFNLREKKNKIDSFDSQTLDSKTAIQDFQEFEWNYTVDFSFFN